ncbi:hypothetical protein [Medusavirus stheno T3]|uniref:Uncharacterized protein n=1 Tax=Medusavirus stheno T3 TaxID=3069717 RepID=A0A7S7YEZ1_9VIRU|nr:hypothetical protein QKU73_gp069 [Acanthamoeba castellanii medusavirus]QPB44250.1 hypothetical protein [Medusavirus stheno T3]
MNNLPLRASSAAWLSATHRGPFAASRIPAFKFGPYYVRECGVVWPLL